MSKIGVQVRISGATMKKMEKAINQLADAGVVWSSMPHAGRKGGYLCYGMLPEPEPEPAPATGKTVKLPRKKGG